METERVRILDLSCVQLKEWLKSIGEPAIWADRILKSVYRDLAATFEEMTDLPPSLRQRLIESAVLTTLKPIQENVSDDGQTRKLLLQLEDGKTVESTLMFYRKSGAGRERRTVCLSSQVGCPIGCGFCATGQQGFERNLRPGEIIEQNLFFTRYLRKETAIDQTELSGRSITNVVFMGMGEPLLNYENVCQAIGILNSPKGLGLGVHQITLSTAGLAPQIRQLAGEGLQFQLAVSLHAATDDLRNRLVPVNLKYPLKELITACKEYSEKTGRRLFFEYALFKGMNDSLKEAGEVVSLLHGLACSVNLIVGNPTSRGEFQPSPVDVGLAFQKKLIAAGIRTMIRVSRGADIEAGCGQLRSRYILKKRD